MSEKKAIIREWSQERWVCRSKIHSTWLTPSVRWDTSYSIADDEGACSGSLFRKYETEKVNELNRGESSRQKILHLKSI